MSNVTIIDEPCGSGKTTRLIKSFSNEKKYLVVVTYLSEVERVIKGVEDVCFYQPSDNGCLKSDSLEALLVEGFNVVTTHSLYSQIVSMARRGLLNDYEVIIDEVPEVCRQVRTKSRVSIDEFYLNSGYLSLGDDGLVCPTSKWEAQCQDVSDTLDKSIYEYARSGCLYLVNQTMFMWALPRELLTLGLSITVLTYKSEGSMLCAYLKKIGIEISTKKDRAKEQAFMHSARSLIEVRDIPSLNKLNLSFSGQVSSPAAAAMDKRVGNALKNLRCREMAGVPLNDILLTCAKSKWFHLGRNDIDKPKTAGFSRGSKIFGCNWVANTTRGTNDYDHCSHLIYLYDQHMNPLIRRWLDVGNRDLQDDYALTELIQWVWRSRVRRGQAITLYLPSKRMRKLFTNWLNQKNDYSFGNLHRS